MKMLTSIICSLLLSAAVLGLQSKFEYDERLEAGAADAAVIMKIRGEGEVGPESCKELDDSIDTIMNRTTTTVVVALAALDLQKAYSRGCMDHAEASETMKDLKREFDARHEREEQNYTATNMVLAVHWFFNPGDRPKQSMPERAETSGLFKLPSASVSH